MSADRMCKVGKSYLSNDSIGKLIEAYTSGLTIIQLAEAFYMTTDQVIKIIDTYYSPALTGDLMSITIPSKII